MIYLHNLVNDRKIYGQGKTFMEGFEKILLKNKIFFEHINYPKDKDFWNKIQNGRLFIARYRGQEADLSLMHSLLPEIERMNVTTLPNFNTVYHCGDKLRLATFFQANQINTPDTFCAFEMDDINYYIENMNKFPVIAKLRRGAGSRNVALIKNKVILKRIAKKIFNRGIFDNALEIEIDGKFNSLIKTIVNPNKSKVSQQISFYKKIGKRALKIESTCLILQDFLQNNKFDTRITVIGDRAFGFIRRNRKNDFRASGSGLIEYDPSLIDERFLTEAFNISKKFNFQTMAYDFIYDDNRKPSLLEMNFTYVDKAVQACPGFWKSDGSYHYNQGRTPQYWQLVDTLSDQNLISPD